jgi:hypothetical protein
VRNVSLILSVFQDKLTRMSEACWTSTTLKKATIRLDYIGEGTSHQFWTTENEDSNRNTPLSLELLPSSARLMELFKTWTEARPCLEKFTINVECRIPHNTMDRIYIPTTWSFISPFPTLAENTDKWYEVLDDKNEPIKVERLSLDVGCAVVAVKDRQVHRICDYMVRQEEACAQLEAMFGPGVTGFGPRRFMRQW